jgi:hypothetical protein
MSKQEITVTSPKCLSELGYSWGLGRGLQKEVITKLSQSTNLYPSLSGTIHNLGRGGEAR